MADPYIDQFETKIYGKFARDQMAQVCLGRLAPLDPMVTFAIKQQEKADAEMAAVLDRQPPKEAPLDSTAVLDEARDVIVRFGSYLDSIKGRPVAPAVFFRGEAPSIVARRRLIKLAAAVGHIVAELPKYKEKLRDHKTWQGEFEEAHAKLEALSKQQRASKLDQVELTPEVAAARERWLVTYNANKALIRGLLGHLGKPELLPLVFDDLAEVHRASGVSDEAAPAAEGAEAAQPA